MDRKEEIRETVGGKKRTERKKLEAVGGSKRTGRKKLGKQFVVRKRQEGRNQGNSWWKEKDRKEEMKRTGRKKPGEQLVARKGQKGRNQGNSRW
jgi:hypothetical protein